MLNTIKELLLVMVKGTIDQKGTRQGTTSAVLACSVIYCGRCICLATSFFLLPVIGYKTWESLSYCREMRW
jgi:hypothetical protein